MRAWWRTASGRRGRRPGAVVALAVAAVVAVVAPPALARTGATPSATSAASAASAASWAPQAPRYGQGSHLDVPVRMGDGTVLRADVYFPTGPAKGAGPATKAAAPGPFPVLLQQTPYGKAIIPFASAIANTDTAYLVDRGYIVVIADVRGTGDSGGTFDLFDPAQARDGATLATWASRLPAADGKVGLFGESYMGINQFQTVGASGPGTPVKALFPIIAGNDLFADTVTQGGIPDVEFASAYIALVSGLNLTNPALEPLIEAAQSGNPAILLDGLAHLAPTEAAHSSTLVSFLQLLANVETGHGSNAFDGPYWQQRSPAANLTKVVADHIPAFLVGGWNDLFQAGEPLNYVGLQNAYAGRATTAPMTATQAVTPRYQLMMGPWEHVTTGQGVNLSAVELEWFDTWLLGQDTPLAHTATPLHLKELNSPQWIDAARWPLPAAKPSAYYFGPGRSASGALSINDGTLTGAAPTAGTGADPVAFTGLSSACDVQTDQWSAGALALLAGSLGTTDPCDTNDITLGAGPGALTYTTAPFSQPMALAGPIDATVYTVANTTDTELAATVEAVSPSGQSLPLTSGALIGSQRAIDATRAWTAANGAYELPVHPLTQASQQPVSPGRVTRQDIEVFPTLAQIPAGWRLRVTVTTGDSPHLLPTAVQLPHLLGGVYQVQHHAGAASLLNVPLAPASAFTIPCGALCSAAGP